MSDGAALRAYNSTLQRCAHGVALSGDAAATLRRTTLRALRLAAFAAAAAPPPPAPASAACLRLFAVKVDGPRWAGPARPAELRERAAEWGESEPGPPAEWAALDAATAAAGRAA